MEAEPKSPSFTCPGSVSRIFPAFTSLEKNRLSVKELHMEAETRARNRTRINYFLSLSRAFTPLFVGLYNELKKIKPVLGHK